MQLLNLSDKHLKKQRKKIIYFIRQHGDRRITKNALNWIKSVNSKDLEQNGTLLLCALEENKLIGLLIVSNYGIDESFMAVHKGYRNQDIGYKLVKETVHRLGKLYGRVALDNIPSLKVCLENDMVAFHLFTGPTNKATLWLGGGQWSKEDVL